MYDIENCEKIIIPQGALYLGPSGKKQSVGYLELKPSNRTYWDFEGDITRIIEEIKKSAARNKAT